MVKHEIGFLGEQDFAKHVSRRLAETDQLIADFMNRHKVLLKQQIADFAQSLGRPSEISTIEDPKQQAMNQVKEHDIIDEKAQHPAEHVNLESDGTNSNLGVKTGLEMREIKRLRLALKLVIWIREFLVLLWGFLLVRKIRMSLLF